MNTKNNVNTKQLSLVAIVSVFTMLVISSCKKDDPKQAVATNPQEVLTTVIINGYNHDDPNNTQYHFSYKWEDLDGDGGLSPVIDTLALDTGIEYHCHVLILDKTKTPVDTVSYAIEDEKNMHQFFYTTSSNLEGKFETEILDFDNNTPALPVGLEFHLNTSGNASYTTPLIGSLNMVLSHYDGVPKTTARSAESDIDITFPVKLK